MNPCPACGRIFFLTQKCRSRHIAWENLEYRKKVYQRYPGLAAKVGIRPDGTVEAKE